MFVRMLPGCERLVVVYLVVFQEYTTAMRSIFDVDVAHVHALALHLFYSLLNDEARLGIQISREHETLSFVQTR